MGILNLKLKLDLLEGECKMLSEMAEQMRKSGKIEFLERLLFRLSEKQKERDEAEKNYLSELSKMN